MNKNRKRLFTVCYLALAFFFTLIIAFYFSRESEGLLAILGSLQLPWLAAAAGCMALYLLTESLVIWYITAFMYRKQKFAYILKLDVIGNYYGAVTPAALGFQSAQIAYMKRDGVPVGISTFIQTIKIMVYEAVIVTLCVVFMAAKGAYYFYSKPEIFWLSVFGAALNASVIAVMALAIAKQSALKKFVLALIRLLAKMRIVRRAEKAEASAERTLAEFHDSAKYIKKHRARAAIACLFTMAQWLFFFSIPYLLYNAFGLGMAAGGAGAPGAVSPFDEAVTIIAMAAFLFLAVHFIPIPGGSGATEAGFGVFFGSFFFAGSAAAMLLWRLITYYSLIALGFMVIFFDGLFQKKRGGAQSEKPEEPAKEQ